MSTGIAALSLLQPSKKGAVAGRPSFLTIRVVFIYFIEEHPAFLPLVAPIFTETAGDRLEIVTSAVTLLEVLVVPCTARNQPLSERYEALLTRSRGVRLIDIDRFQLRAAAQLRARYAVRTPDALQLAAALSHRCTAFVTNDRALPKIPGLVILQLNYFREPRKYRR